MNTKCGIPDLITAYEVAGVENSDFFHIVYGSSFLVVRLYDACITVNPSVRFKSVLSSNLLLSFSSFCLSQILVHQRHCVSKKIQW